MVTFTFTAELPGRSATPATGTAVGDQVLTWSAPLDQTTVDVASTFVLAQGTPSSLWGTVATIALVALVAWSLLAVAFIAVVVRARKQRAQRRPTL